MKKVLASALLCAGLGSNVSAGDDIFTSKTFIGLELGYSEVQGDVGSLVDGEPVIEKNFTGDYDLQYGFRVGAQNESWRTTFIFDYYDSSDNNMNVEQGYFTVDYFILEKESTLRPYIGLNVGYANYESDYVDDSGFLYGAQAGIVLAAGENINLDIGYRYSLSDIDSMDHIGSVVFAASYIF